MVHSGWQPPFVMVVVPGAPDAELDEAALQDYVMVAHALRECAVARIVHGRALAPRQAAAVLGMRLGVWPAEMAGGIVARPDLHSGEGARCVVAVVSADEAGAYLGELGLETVACPVFADVTPAAFAIDPAAQACERLFPVVTAGKRTSDASP